MTLTPEQIADGWLPHDGSECPVPLDTRPGVKFRNLQMRLPFRWSAKTWSDCWQWQTEPRDIDIIAYKPEPRP